MPLYNPIKRSSLIIVPSAFIVDEYFPCMVGSWKRTFTGRVLMSVHDSAEHQ